MKAPRVKAGSAPAVSVQREALTNSPSKRNRFTLELDSKTLRILREIEHDAALATRTQAIVEAIYLADLLMRYAKRQGHVIASLDPATGAYTEIDSRLFSAVRPRDYKTHAEGPARTDAA
jgi:hypothetical protein